VIEVLAKLVSVRGAPRYLRSDDGSEFVSRAILRWLAEANIETALIDPGKPWQNGAAESFNGKLRDECLSMQWFKSRADATDLIEDWAQMLQEADDLRGAHDVGVRGEQQPGALGSARRVGHGTDRGEVSPGAEAMSQDRGLSPRRPRATDRRPFREAALVEEDDRGAAASGVFFSAGQVVLTQWAIACSSRSRAAARPPPPGSRPDRRGARPASAAARAPRSRVAPSPRPPGTRVLALFLYYTSLSSYSPRAAPRKAGRSPPPCTSSVPPET
jgi:hypothetical protein